MKSYNRSEYESAFAQLLERSLAKGKNDPGKALKWLNRPFRYSLAIIFNSNRLETTDAFLDVREHLEKRIKLFADLGKENIEEL
jgi:hypothetical protein